MRKVVNVFLLSLIAIGLFSCASSQVARDTTVHVDNGVSNAKKIGTNLSDGDIVDSYQNASQKTKGAILGGATGAVLGAVTSSVGIFPGTIVGAIFGGAYGSYIDSQTTLSDKLINRDVNVIELGDQLMVVLPSARIFDGQSDKIKPTAFSTLNLVADYINSYTTMLVKISGYTDNSGSSSRDLALSRQQAQSIERYLAAVGVNTRVLYAEGYGGTNLVSPNTDDWGRSDNYRIEITMEKIDV